MIKVVPLKIFDPYRRRPVDLRDILIRTVIYTQWGVVAVLVEAPFRGKTGGQCDLCLILYAPRLATKAQKSKRVKKKALNKRNNDSIVLILSASL